MNKIAFLGNYAPRCCGIATFTQDLRNAVLSTRSSLQAPVVMMTDKLYGYAYPKEVQLKIEHEQRLQYRQTAQELNQSGIEVLSLQHEYGIYGGRCGAWLLDLLRDLRVPVVTTCHTVLAQPSREQHHVLCSIARHSSQMIVMAEKGRSFLREIYGVPDDKITVIPHGIPNAQVSPEQRTAVRQSLGWLNRRVMFTFGLLAPNKGLEYAVRALPAIVKKHPDLLYVIAGVTHPNLVQEEGEAYRESLLTLATELGVSRHLQFIDRFVSRDELVNLLAAADLYTTPYLNEAQITSGTLAYAYGLGKPVISTPYWHAAELLAKGHGLLVPFRDHEALSTAAQMLLDHPTLSASMSAAALQHGREMTWSAVGARYLEVFRHASAPPVRRMTPAWTSPTTQRTHSLHTN